MAEAGVFISTVHDLGGMGFGGLRGSACSCVDPGLRKD